MKVRSNRISRTKGGSSHYTSNLYGDAVAENETASACLSYQAH
jgi:hypothetical protein